MGFQAARVHVRTACWCVRGFKLREFTYALRVSAYGVSSCESSRTHGVLVRMGFQAALRDWSLYEYRPHPVSSQPFFFYQTAVDVDAA